MLVRRYLISTRVSMLALWWTGDRSKENLASHPSTAGIDFSHHVTLIGKVAQEIDGCIQTGSSDRFCGCYLKYWNCGPTIKVWLICGSGYWTLTESHLQVLGGDDDFSSTVCGEAVSGGEASARWRRRRRLGGLFCSILGHVEVHFKNKQIFSILTFILFK